MSTTANAEKTSAIPAVSADPFPTTTRTATSKTKTKTVLVGFDLGTNKSCVLAGTAGSADITLSKIVPSVVGYVKEGIVDGIIAGKECVLNDGQFRGTDRDYLQWFASKSQKASNAAHLHFGHRGLPVKEAGYE